VSQDVQVQHEYLQVDKEKCVFNVPHKAFIDQDIFEKEREKIFNKCWLYLGHESEVENVNEYKTRTVGGRPLIFNKDSNGQINAFLNACPHRGAMVCREREGNSKVFRCFYHAWTFNNKGGLAGTPDGKDGYPEDHNADGSKNLIRVPRLESYRGFIFVNFDKDAMSLEDYLAGAKEYIDLVADQSEIGMEIVHGTQDYSVRANWKLLCENSADGYHALPTHKTYFDYVIETNEIKYDKNKEDLSIARDLGNGHVVTEKAGMYPWGRPVAKWIPAWGEDGKQEIEAIRKRLVDRFGEERAKRIAEHDFNMIIFPNFVINNIMAITVRTFYPKSPTYMEATQWAIGPKEEDRKLRHRRLDNYLEFLGPGGFATPDDNEALELCHRGYEATNGEGWNDLSKGMHKELRGEIPKNYDEYHMRAFWTQWEKMMTEE
jgi:p-cumate 2,3-dioxygenase subunit alpha